MEEAIEMIQNESSGLLKNTPVEEYRKFWNDNIQQESFFKDESNYYSFQSLEVKKPLFKDYKVLLTTKSTTGISNIHKNPFDKERKSVFVEAERHDNQSFFGPDLLYIFYNNKFIPYEKVIEFLLKDFKFENEEILKFLTKNSNFISHLVVLSDTLKIRENFQNPALFLDYHLDPEENDEFLNIIIKVDLRLNDAIKLEKTFFDDFFKSIYQSTNGKLNFRIEPHEL